MKLLVFADNHWCEYSSILRSQGDKYSTRLENQIKCLNWIEDTAITNNVSQIICLGDFFDKAELNCNEIKALSEIHWGKIPHTFIVGNHEINSRDLFYNSVSIFNNTFIIEDKPICYTYDLLKLQICFLPYCFEHKPLNDYFGKKPNDYHRLVFSHNDIAGIQMGKFISQDGFEISDIEDNCDLFINGHLHNGQDITSKIINLGNLTGQNFSEDGFIYNHRAMLIDTDNGSYEFINNPYAVYFYKIDFCKKDIDYINSISSKLQNAVVSITCDEKDYQYIKARFDPNSHSDIIPHNCNILACRINVKVDKDTIDEENKIENLRVDHIEQFKEYVIQDLGGLDLVLQELNEVTK